MPLHPSCARVPQNQERNLRGLKIVPQPRVKPLPGDARRCSRHGAASRDLRVLLNRRSLGAPLVPRRTFSTDALEQYGGGFVIRVLVDKLALERPLEDRLAKALGPATRVVEHSFDA